MNPGAMMTSYEDAKGRRGDKTEKRLKFIAPLRNERTEATSDHADYLGLENIQSWTGKLLPSATSDFSEDDNSASGTANVFYSGDVLFGKLRPYLAKALHADKDGVCSTELLVLKPQPDIHPRFLLYSMLSPDFVGQVDASTFGAKMPRANWEFIGSMKLSIPTYETQRLIADYLDRETGRIDALVAEKEKMLALLEEKRAALISRVVTRGLDESVPRKPSGLDWLGEIPEHWEVCQLKRTWASADYGLSDNIRDEGGITVLRMSCIVDSRIDITKAGTIEEADEYLYLRKGDLLFNRTNSLDQIAKVGLVDFDPEFPLTFASYLVRIRINHRASPEYLAYLLNSRDFLEYARKNAIAAIGQANLSPSRYGEIHIPLPGVEEQNKITQVLNEDAELLSPLRKNIQDSIHLLHERRAALITAAVTGRIPVEEMTA